MPRSDILIKLIKAGLSNNKKEVEKATETIIADERKKQHHNLAERLTKLLRSAEYSRFRHSSTEKRPYELNGANNKGSFHEYLAELKPCRCLDDLILPEDCVKKFKEIVEEQHRSDVLRSHGLEPRHRILLAGPPGNGKTTFAEALAFELGSAFYVVRYETVIGSFLGETSARLKRIFDYARTMPCVLFFDEFDTLGKERGDTHETGEIKRVVSSLLLQIDELPSYTIVVTATNHPELLDRAVWRRFQVRMELPPPSKNQLKQFIERFFSRFDDTMNVQYDDILDHLIGLSYAEAEDFCLNVQRRHILSLGQNSLDTIIKAQSKLWKARYTPNQS